MNGEKGGETAANFSIWIWETRMLILDLGFRNSFGISLVLDFLLLNFFFFFEIIVAEPLFSYG